MVITRRSVLVILALTLSVAVWYGFLATAAEPDGASVSPGTPNRSLNNTPGWVYAWAGNITELTVSGNTTTQTWQGYYGNITGVIRLADSSGRVMYNWTLASPRGELYATTNLSVQWLNVQCFNYTATGTKVFAGEANPGQYSLAGTNLTELHYQFNVSGRDPDGVNNTFQTIGAATGHELFFTNNVQFSEGFCYSTRIFTQNGWPAKGTYEEVLLYEPLTTSVIFTSIIDNNLAGFDGAMHDFEMLVLENGHGTDRQTTQYYFYVELE